MKWMSGVVVGFSIVSSSAIAEDNPDSGSRTRVLCYEVAEAGNADTRNHDFSIILQQVDSEVDSSFFIPGNKNYTAEDFVFGAEFDVYIYKNAARISSANDPRALASELLAAEADIFYDGVEGIRSDGTLAVNWMNNGISVVEASQDAPRQSNYVDSGTDDSRFLFCEPPFGVPAE